MPGKAARLVGLMQFLLAGMRRNRSAPTRPPRSHDRERTMSLDSDRWRCYDRGMKINAVLDPQPEGGFTAYIPALPGCVSEGDTEASAKKNLLDALQGYLAVANKRSLTLAKAKEGKVFSLQV